MKCGGGEGGHNGLRSMSKSLGTKDYVRVRFGIGRPPGRQDPADYVLSDFSAAERKELEFLVDRAADVVEAVVVRGVEPTQNLYHGGLRRPGRVSDRDRRGVVCAVRCGVARPATRVAADGRGARIAARRRERAMGSPPMIDGAFARWLAARAGQALLGLRAELGFADAGRAEVGRRQGLARPDPYRAGAVAPGDAVLSEEDEGSRLAWAAEVSTGAVSRLTADRVWIIDPLDGTREFAEEGRSDWAVHVALWARRRAEPRTGWSPGRWRCRRSTGCWAPTTRRRTRR